MKDQMRNSGYFILQRQGPIRSQAEMTSYTTPSLMKVFRGKKALKDSTGFS